MKIAFLCIENSCRSQIAEALAKKMFCRSPIEFVSAGTHPSRSVDPMAIKVLNEEGINWNRKPKHVSTIGKADIVVTMGCDVECPYIPGAKIVGWDIPDPKGKLVEEYRRVRDRIKQELSRLIKRVSHE
jgi:arsenate reductase